MTMSAQEFADTLRSKLPASIAKYTKVGVSKILGQNVEAYFAHTDSKSSLDLLNAPHIKIFVQGWDRDGADIDPRYTKGLEAKTLTKYPRSIPSFRAVKGSPEKVLKSLTNYFKRKEKDLLATELYGRHGNPTKRSSNPTSSLKRSLLQ